MSARSTILAVGDDAVRLRMRVMRHLLTGVDLEKEVRPLIDRLEGNLYQLRLDLDLFPQPLTEDP